MTAAMYAGGMRAMCLQEFKSLPLHSTPGSVLPNLGIILPKRIQMALMDINSIIRMPVVYILPTVIGFLCFFGFSNFISLYPATSPGQVSKDALNFIWNIILFAFVLGTLVSGMKLDKRKNIDKTIERSGFAITLSGLIIAIGLAFQGFYLSSPQIEILRQVGEFLSTAGELVLFLGISFFTIRLAQKMFED